MEIRPLQEYEPPVTAAVTRAELAALRATSDGTALRQGDAWLVSDARMYDQQAQAFTSLLERGLITVQEEASSAGGHQVEITTRGLQAIGVNDHRSAEI